MPLSYFVSTLTIENDHNCAITQQLKTKSQKHTVMFTYLGSGIEGINGILLTAK